MRRPEPLLLLLVLLSACATAPVLLGWSDFGRMGALSKRALWEGEVWRLLASILLHGGILHLALNSMSLFVVGNPCVLVAGRRATLGIFLLSALGGHAASLLLTLPGDLELLRVGMSGGVLGLVGFLLAREAGHSRSVGEFFRRRNAVVLLSLLLVNLVLARFFPTIDEWAHHGGTAAGFLVSLPLFLPRRFPRLPLAAASTLLFVLLPLAYAAHPFADPRFREWRGSRDFLEACGRLPEEPSLLESMREPRTAREAAAFSGAVRALAVRLAEERPGEAAEAVRRAERLLPGRRPFPDLWARIAVAARSAGERALARRAWHHAAIGVPLAAAAAPALEAVRLALGELDEPGAADWLDELLEDLNLARGRLPEAEPDVAAAALAAAALAERMPDSPARARLLGRAFQGLAETTESAANSGRYLYRSAYWGWKGRGEGGDEEALLRRMEAAERDAAGAGDEETAVLARAWLEERRRADGCAPCGGR